MRIKTKEEFEKELLKRFPNNNVEILQYSGASKPIRYRCLECGREYYKNRANHLYENKTLCQRCFTARDSKIRDDFLNKVANSNFEVVSPVGSTASKVSLKCKKCGNIFKIDQSNFLTKTNECPYCGKYGELFVDQKAFEIRMGNKIKDYKIIEYKNITSSAKFQHSCSFVFSQKAIDFLNSRGCPKCFKRFSKGERKIIDWLEENNIEYIYQKKFPELGLKSYDFYIPQKNTLIEYQGMQHYKPTNYYGGEEKFRKQQESDKIKASFAKENNIDLIIIPYYEKDIYKFLLPLKVQRLSQEGVASSEAKKN